MSVNLVTFPNLAPQFFWRFCVYLKAWRTYSNKWV